MKKILKASLKTLMVFSFLFVAGCGKNKEVNLPPTCTITAPANNAEFLANENITITVTADVKGATITEVRLYVDNVGHSSKAAFPYNFTLLAGSLALGSHTLRVEAIDNNGAKGESTVNITVKVTIGMSYQGGKVAYIDGTGTHGLIAAPTDQSSGIRWDNGSLITTGATDWAIGTGKSNTDKIVAACGTASDYAAKLCKNLVLNGYSDWFLPSRYELNELYKNRGLIGGFENVSYWSSSEYRYNTAYRLNFNNGSWAENTGKGNPFRVRAVRYF